MNAKATGLAIGLALLALQTASLCANNFPPVVVSGVSSDEIVLGETSLFSSAGTFDPNGDPLTYLWNFGDGNTSAAPHPSHDYAQAGHYTVSLRVSDGQVNRFAGLTVTVLEPVAALQPTSSRTMALATTRNEIWVVNPESNTVGVLNVSTDSPVLVQEILVGDKPRTVAFSLDESLAYVACEGANALYVINVATRAISQTRATGHMPFGVAVARNDGRVVVTNQGDGTLTIFTPDLSGASAVATGETPRAIAITGDGAYAYVTDYFTQGDVGTVWKVDLATGVIAKTILLVEDPGPDTTSSGQGFPNILSTIEIEPSGKYLWVGGIKSNTGRGLFANGLPLLPTNRVRGVLIGIDLMLDEEVLGHRIDTNNADMASAIGFSPNGRYLATTHQGAETLSFYDLPFAKALTDKSDGEAVPFFRTAVGSAPQGVLISPDATRAYVNNFMSRTLSVHDLGNLQSVVLLGQSPTANAEPLDPNLLNGKRKFYRSTEPVFSVSNYISCVSCHADGGMADGRTWDFTEIGEGLRNTIDLRGKGGMAHGPVHWSANFDEIQDFENDIVHAFGGLGLAQDGEGPHPSLSGPPNAGRSQDLDDLAAYVASLDAPPPSPHRDENGLLVGEALVGRELFHGAAQGCTTCHGTPRFTDSVLTLNPANYLLHDVGTLLPSSGGRLGGPLPGLDTPSLQGAWATPPYLHDGRAATLRDVVTTHNVADAHGNTSHLSPSQIDALVAYLQSIDGSPNDRWPTVNAGPDFATNAGWLEDLVASVSDDGLPATPGATAVRWESNDPGAVIEQNDDERTGIVFSAPGEYTLTLLASDDGGITWPSSQVLNVSVGGNGQPIPQSYNEFRQGNFSAAEQLNNAISGMGANPDGDPNINLYEYYQSSLPKVFDGDSLLSLDITTDAAGVAIQHDIRSKATDATTAWLRSTNLEDWFPIVARISGYVLSADGAFTIETRFDSDPATEAFYRLEISAGD